MKKKRVLLFSSGMDSYIINQLEQPDVLLFINNKSEYAELEMNFLKKMKYGNLVILDDFINMKKIERPDGVIPLRNMYFVAAAAEYGDEILMGVTNGDMLTDKDYVFSGLMTDLLRHFYADARFDREASNIRVDFSNKRFTKVDLIIELAHKREREGSETPFGDVARELAENTFSCYHPNENGRPCCVCKSCMRKYLSVLTATSIDLTVYGDPYYPKLEVERIKELIKEEKSHFRGRESEDIIKALNKLMKQKTCVV
jgi:7-cyano-7-deazaguanine synthase in queuosine biosynthesis